MFFVKTRVMIFEKIFFTSILYKIIDFSSYTFLSNIFILEFFK